MVLPWEGNGITIRLVIPLPTRKNFGNPIFCVTSKEVKTKTPIWQNETPICSDERAFDENNSAFQITKKAALGWQDGFLIFLCFWRIVYIVVKSDAFFAVGCHFDYQVAVGYQVSQLTELWSEHASVV